MLEAAIPELVSPGAGSIGVDGGDADIMPGGIPPSRGPALSMLSNSGHSEWSMQGS